MAFDILFSSNHDSIMDLSQSNISNIIPGRFLNTLDIQCVFTGTPTGTFSVETSDDKVNWDELNIDSKEAIGSGDTHSFHINVISAMFYRVVYNYVSGTGSCTVMPVGKVI